MQVVPAAHWRPDWSDPMPSTRCIVRTALIALGLAALAGTAGCSESTSPAARAWERSNSMTRNAPSARMDLDSLMAASDRLGSRVFAPTDEPAVTRSTFANVPTE